MGKCEGERMREKVCVWGGGGQGKEYFNEELGIPK